MANPSKLSRRLLLQSSSMILASAATYPSSSFAAVVGRMNINGRVLDAENTGSGISDVLVTNGVDVVRTDQNGFYQLPLHGDSIISVIKPAGYSAACESETQCSKFFYIHQPAGTPPSLEFEYPGILPTGELPASVNFELRKVDEPEKFDVVLFADPQPENHQEVSYIRDGVIPDLIGTNAAFGITLGDIVDNDLSLYPRIKSLIGKIGIPWYNVLGNHDLNFEAPSDQYARDTFKRHFGPTYYAFEHGRALFIALDNIVYHGSDPIAPGKMGGYHDGFSDDQLAFVKNLLAYTPKDRLIVLTMHVPLRSRKNLEGMEVATDDTAKLLDIIGDRNCISFSGHTHTSEHRYIHRQENTSTGQPHHHQVLSTVCGSWWSGPLDSRGIPSSDACDGSPNGYYILSVDGLSATTDFHSLSEAVNKKIRLSLVDKTDPSFQIHKPSYSVGHLIAKDRISDYEALVNFFDGGPRSQLELQFVGYRSQPMRRLPRIDPFVASIYAKNIEKLKVGVEAEPSSHTWVADLPNGLSIGTHSIRIKAVDEFGGEHYQHAIVEIVDGHENHAFHMKT